MLTGVHLINKTFILSYTYVVSHQLMFCRRLILASCSCGWPGMRLPHHMYQSLMLFPHCLDCAWFSQVLNVFRPRPLCFQRNDCQSHHLSCIRYTCSVYLKQQSWTLFCYLQPQFLLFSSSRGNNKPNLDPSQHLGWPSIPANSAGETKRSKTDQLGLRVGVFVGRTDGHLCPVEGVLAYMASCNQTEGPFFKICDGQPLTKARFTTLCILASISRFSSLSVYYCATFNPREK